MQTAEEKAAQFIDGFKGNDRVRYEFGEELELNLLAGIHALLTEQDRETRQACAEAIQALEIDSRSSGHMINGFIHCKGLAHKACMNVSAK